MYKLMLLVCLPLQAANFFPAPTQAAVNAAILAANTNGENDVIDLSGQTIVLTALEPGGTSNALRPILSDGGFTLTIRNGQLMRSPPDANNVQTAPDMRIIQVGTAVSTGANLSIEHLVLRNGYFSIPNSGGAILVANASRLASVTQSLFEDNVVEGGGGAIAYGIVGLGGATAGSLIESTKFNRNSANEGGAIHVFSTTGINITRSIFSNNRALAEGAAQAFGGAINVTAGTIASIDEVSFTRNSSTTTGTNTTFGGAISVRSSGATNGFITLLSDSTFEGNTAGNGGGAIYLAGVAATSSAIIAKISQSTLFGNRATDLTGAGGAIHIATAGQITNLFNSTIARNTATTGGGINFALAPSGADNTINTLRSTIVALNTATTGPDIAEIAAGNIVLANEGTNLVGNNGGSFLVAGTPNANLSYVGTAVTPIDPVLSNGEDNGGFTKTLAILSPTSVAVDNGTNSDNLLFDQRGEGYLRERVVGQPDIGAYELQNCGVGNDDDFDGICDDVDECDLNPND